MTGVALSGAERRGADALDLVTLVLGAWFGLWTRLLSPKDRILNSGRT